MKSDSNIDVCVHPIGGMQLAQGSIHEIDRNHFEGSLPGMMPVPGNTLGDVLEGLERLAQDYYGDDVVVELSDQLCLA